MFTKRRLIKIQWIIVLLGGLSPAAIAQYGTPGNSIGKFLSENPDLKQTENHIVDVAYERGKSVFLGRKLNIPKLSYCVTHKATKAPVKRSNMDAFKFATYTELSRQLYNCEKPDSKIINELPRKAFIDVLYFLDVKYKLNLLRE